MPRSFDEIPAANRGRSRGCPRCGADRNAGTVTVAAQKLSAKGQMAAGGRLASKTISLCESCTVDVFEAVRSHLLAEAAGPERSGPS